MPHTTASLASPPQPELTWRDGLEWLVAPMPAEEFLRLHWRAQRAVYIPSPASKIEGFYDLAAHHAAVARIKPDHVRAAYDDSSPERCDLTLEEALDHFSRGATVCVTSLQSADDVLKEWCAILNRQFVSPDRFYVNSYYSADRQGFRLHYDPQSVWIVQIEGRKRWRFSREPELEYPLEGTSAELLAARGSNVPKLEDLVCVDLSPGDVLYLPAGTWHKGEALDGPSLALSLSQPHDGIVPILTRVIGSRFGAIDWHRHFPTAIDGAAAIEAHLASALASLHAITLDELRDAWSTLAIPSGDEKANGDGDLLRLAQPLLTFDRGDALLIYARGKRYTLPSVCRELFAALAREREIGRDDAAALLEDDRELLADLVQIGAVVTA